MFMNCKIIKKSILLVAAVFCTQFAYAQNLYISGGNDYGLVLCQDGGVLTWGKGNLGQLGNGTNTAAQRTPVPVTLPSGIKFLQADAGSGRHALALDCGGDVWAWGSNSDGQLGIATGTSSNVPVKVRGIGCTGQLSNVAYVSGGDAESFAILDNGLGEVISWGQNDKNQLGRGPIATGNPDDACPGYVQKSAARGGGNLGGIGQIEAGDENGYALDENGNVWSWGDYLDGSHQLGRNCANVTCASRADYVVRADNGQPLSDIIAISAGDRHVLALDINGNVWSWGGDWGPGQLGLGTGYQQSGNWGATLVVSNTGTGVLANVVSIAAGQAHSMAALANGSVVTWGTNCFFDGVTNTLIPGGQLGRNVPASECSGPTGATPDNSTNRDYPQFAKLCSGANISNILAVSDGDASTYAVDANGTIYVAGYNGNGELGMTGASRTCMTPLTLTSGCAIPDTCPTPNLTPASTNLCPAALPYTMTLPTTDRKPSYTYQWFYRATAGSGAWASIASATTFTYNGTKFGEYKIEVRRGGGTCSECDLGKDSITVNEIKKNFNDVAGGTFCTSPIKFSLTGPAATYTWYRVGAGGTAVGTSTGANSSITVAASRAFGAISGTDSTYTLYVSSSLYSCTRDTVVMTKYCPCSPPTSLGLAGNTVFCSSAAGITVTTSPKPTIPTTLPANYIYEWYHGSVAAGNKMSSSTASQAISPASFGGGTYILRVGHTSTTTSTCYRDTTFTVKMITPIANNTITGDQSICSGGVVTILDGAVATGGTTTPPTYIWASSTTQGGPYTDISTATSEDYTPTGVSATTYFVRRVTSNTPCNTSTSNEVRIFVDQAFSPGTVTGGIICEGSSGTLTYTNASASATGYKWYTSTDGINYTISSSNTSATINTGILNVTTWFKREVASVACTGSDTARVLVNKALGNNTITGNAQVCETDPVPTITASVATGTTATPAYQWLRSTDGTTWNAVAGQTTQNYTAAIALGQTYLRRAVFARDSTTACKTIISAPISIFRDPIVNPGTIGSDQNICSGNSATLTSTLAPSGGTAPLTYVWQSATNSSGPWVDIAGSNSVSLSSAPAITVTTYYRRVTTSTVCSANTNTVTANVAGNLIPGVANGPFDICYNTSTSAITAPAATGGTGSGPVYQWESSATGTTGSWADIGGETGLAYQPGNLTTDIYYRRKATNGSGACDVGYAGPVYVKVYPQLVAGTISGAVTICSGKNATISDASAATGGKPTLGYTWESSPDGSTWNPVASETNASLSVTNLTSTTQYRRVATDACPTKVQTTEVTITVDPTLTPSITLNNPTPECQNVNLNFAATNPVNLGTTPTYSWKVNGGSVGSNSSTYSIPSGAVDGDVVEVTVQPDNTVCTFTPAVASVTLVITGTVVPSVSISANPICEGDPLSITASASGKGNMPTYKWTIGGAVDGGTTTDTYNFSNPTDGLTVEVELTSSSGCAVPKTISSSPITLKVYTKPKNLTITSSAPTPLCDSVTVGLTLNNAPSGSTIEWQKGGVRILGATSATYNTNQAGSYTAEVTNVLPACKASAPPEVLSPLPLQNPDFVVSSGASYCAAIGNHIISTTNLVDLGANPTFKWFINGLYDNALDGKTFYVVDKSIATITQVEAVIDAAYISANIPCSQNAGPISRTATVIVNPQPVIKFIIGGDTICAGEATNILVDDTLATKGASYAWWYNPLLPTSVNSIYLGATIVPVLPNNSREGHYYVRATNAGNCTDDASFYLTIEEPKVFAGPTREIEEGNSIALEGIANEDVKVFNWSPIQTIYGYENPLRPIVGPLVDTDYKLIGISKAGCIDSSFVTVKVIQKIKIPNAFSPNGDGKNDTWRILNIDDYPENEVIVYNRWGGVVFNTVNYNNEWDGTRNGLPLSTGTYYYIVEIKKGNKPYTGALTIVR